MDVRNGTVRSRRLARLAAAIVVAVSPLSCAGAQEKPSACNAEEKGGTMSEGTYRVLERAIEDMNNERFADAEKRLLDIAGRSDGFERATVYQTLGFVYAQQEKLGEALDAFEEALAVGALQRKAQEELMFNVGQLYIANEQYDKGIATIERYLELACEPPPATAHMMLANAYAQASKYEPALEHVLFAFEKADKVEESWLQLKLALHYELKDYRQSAQTLVQLIATAPDNAQYWKQLSGVLLEIEEQTDALAVLALAERQGMLDTERDVKSLASIYLMLEIPYKAAVLVEERMAQGIVESTAENHEYLAEAWIAAHEWDKAESALRRVAELSSDGDAWKRLAQVLMEKEDWVGARDALERALAAGVENPGETQYLLGVAAFQAGDARRAEAALRSAAEDPSTREQARQWLAHIAANR